MKILVTGVSGYVGSALAPPRRDGHRVRGFARSAARVQRRGRARRARARGRDHRRGAAGALDGIEVAYYLIHSMEGPGEFVDVERRQAEAFAAAAARGGRAADRLPRRPAPPRRVAVAPPRLAPGGGAGAAGRRAGVDRAARLDRGRRPLALLPLPRAADRAPAGPRPAGVAGRTAHSRSTGATCSSS